MSRRRQLNTTLNEDDAIRLDEIATAQGISRYKLVKKWVSEGIQATGDSVVDVVEPVVEPVVPLVEEAPVLVEADNAPKDALGAILVGRDGSTVEPITVGVK